MSDFVKQNSDFDLITDKIKFKINGEGARMTRNPNLFCFHLLFCKQRSQVCLLTK